MSRDWPVLEDPANYGYFREEGGGLMLGMFEPVCAPWRVDGIPADFSLRRAAAGLGPDGPVPGEDDVPDTDLVGGRHPQVLLRAGELHAGPGARVLGEAPELRNYFVAAGLNSIGILTGGGIGRVMAHWIVNGRPDVDVTGMNIDRLHAYQANPEYRATRTVESLGMVYATHYPAGRCGPREARSSRPSTTGWSRSARSSAT